MSESKLSARIVRLDYSKGSTGLFYATSPDLKGLVLGRPSVEALEEAIPKAIVEMYAACGEQVVVTKISPDDNLGEAWVAVPSDVARRALDKQSATSA